MSDEYSSVARGKLKLRSSEGSVEIKKKSKKRKREKEKLKKIAESSIRDETTQDQGGTGGRTDGVPSAASSTAAKRTLTKAELAFKQMQEKQQKKRILEKASLTHKQRVEKFNQHLDSLTEHFDIPKVSWTK